MIKRILVGVSDPLSTVSIASHAVELSRRFDATVTSISVTDSRHLTEVGPVAIGAGSFARELIRERIENNEAAIRQSFDILVRRLRDANISSRVFRESTSPYSALAEASRYHDLMIFGLQGLFEHGVTDEPPHELVHLIESGVRPILAVGTNHRDIHRILVAYSGSIESAKAMKSFANLAPWPDALLKIVHFASEADESESLLVDARSYLQGHGFEVEVESVDDPSRDRLLRHAAAWQADLIVLGNSSKSLLRRRVFGDIALRTIRESQLPLFLSQ